MFFVVLGVLSFVWAGGHMINNIEVVSTPSVINSWDPGKFTSLLRETKDIRASFVHRELPVEEGELYWFYVQKCGDEAGHLLYADQPATIRQCLVCLDSVDPSKDGTSYVEMTQPQIKLIRKNAIFQTEWQQLPSEEFLGITLESGDLLYIACFD